MIQIIDIYPDMCDVRGDTQANVWNGGTALVHEGGTALVQSGGYAWVYEGDYAYVQSGGTAAGPGEIEWEGENDD